MSGSEELRLNLIAAITKVESKYLESWKKSNSKIKLDIIPNINLKSSKANLLEFNKRMKDITLAGGDVRTSKLVPGTDQIKEQIALYRTEKGIIEEVWTAQNKLDKNKKKIPGQYKDAMEITSKKILPETAQLPLEKELTKVAYDRASATKKLREENERLLTTLQKQNETVSKRAENKLASVSSKQLSGKYEPSSEIDRISGQLSSAIASSKTIPMDANYASNLEASNKQISSLTHELGLAEKGMVRVAKAEEPLKSKSFAESIKEKASSMLQYASVTAILFGALQQLREGITYIKELNKEMTDIQIVTGATSGEMQNMTVEFNNLAREVGATTLEVAQGSLQWARQGKSASDTALLLKNSMMMSKLAGIDSAEATDYMTSIMNGFNLTATETIGVLDKLVALDNDSATSVAELAEAMRRSSSVAQQSGVDFEHLAAYITVASSVTRRSASTIGEAFKTILTRMGDIKEGALDEEGMDINKVETALKSIDVQLRDSSGTFRDFDDVLDEVGKKWDTLSVMEQNYVAAALGGTRQRNVLLAVMSNYNQVSEDQISVEGALATERNAAGLATDRYAIYLESLAASQNKAKVAWEEMWQATIQSDFVKLFYDSSAGIMELIANIGGLIPLVTTLGLAFLAFKYNISIPTIAEMTTALYALIIPTKVTTAAMGELAVAQTAINATNPIGWIILATGALVMYANSIETTVEKQARLTEEISTLEQELSRLRDSSDKIRKLSDEFENLRDKTNKTNEESKRFTEIQNQLKETIPGLAGSFDKYGNFIVNASVNMKDLNKETLEQIRLKEELRQATLDESAETEAYSVSQGYASYVKGMRSNKASDKEEAYLTYTETINEAKQKFLSMSDDGRKVFLETLKYTENGAAIIGQFEQLISDALSSAKETQIKGEKFLEGDKSNIQTFEYKGLAKTTTDLSAMADGFTKLYKAQEEFGKGSAEVSSALQDFLGESVDASQFLLEDGTVNFDKLREEQLKYLDDLVSNLDSLENVTDGEKNAIRSMVEEIRKSVQTFDVLGYQVSQSTFLDFGDALSQEMWKAVEEMQVGSVTIGNQTLNSAGEILSYIKMYPEQLLDVIKAFVQISGEGAATFVQQWSSALGALGGVSAMPDMYSTLGVQKPSSISGGGGSGGSSSAEKDKLEQETKALENKKKALDDYLDEFKKYIEAQKEALKLEKEELAFTKEILEKNKSLAMMKTEIAILALDTSEEARVKRLKLEEDAAKLEEEIVQDTEDRKYELQNDALDKALKDYEDNIEAQKKLLDDKINKIKEESSAIDNVSGSLGGASSAMQTLGAITAEQGRLIVTKFSDMLKLSDSNKTKLQEQINKWVDMGIAAEEAYIMAWNYANTLASIKTWHDANQGYVDYIQGEKDYVPAKHHAGGFAGGLQSNEEFAKLLKGEYVATEGQMSNFMKNILPKITGISPQFSQSPTSIELNMPINVAGSLDKTILPDMEKIASKVMNEINKVMKERGYIRQTSLTGI